MYLGDKIYDFHGTIGAGATLEPNSGSYWSAATVDSDHETWFETVYDDDHAVSPNHWPSHIVMNVYSSDVGTAYVYENEHRQGDAHHHDSVESGSIDLKGGTSTQFETQVDAEYFHVTVENGGASPSTIGVTIRMVDKYQ